MTHSSLPFKVPLLSHKPVAIDFAGGDLSSDAGLIPLALADQAMQLTRHLADAVADPRDPHRIEHSLPDLFRVARDPEYGRRANRLRARVAEHPGRPLVLVVGSSRTAMGVCPSAWEDARPGSPHDPLLWPPGYEKKYDPARMPLPANFRARHPFG